MDQAADGCQRQLPVHDLRHTAITKLAESGASDSTIMALAGHLSRAMLERYSHIRMNAKRQAVESLTLKPRAAAAHPSDTLVS